MNKIFKFSALFSLIAASFFSCKKVEQVDALGDGGYKMIGFRDVGGKDTLQSSFGNATLVLDPSASSQDFQYQLVYSTPTLSDVDITVHLDVDTTLVAAYMAYYSKIPFVPMPADLYSIPSKTVVIKAGQVESEPFTLTTYSDMFDPSISYMLPIRVTSIDNAPSDVIPAPGTGIAYFHVIGNPLAGNYNMTGIRYNYTGSHPWNGPPDPLPAGGTVASNYAGVKFAAPIDALNVTLPMGNVPDPATGALAQYIITSSDLSATSISYDFAATFNAGYSNIDRFIVSYTAPTLTVKPAFHLITHYNNTTGGAGNDRIIDQTFVHQ